MVRSDTHETGSRRVGGESCTRVRYGTRVSVKRSTQHILRNAPLWVELLATGVLAERRSKAMQVLYWEVLSNMFKNEKVWAFI